MNLDQYSLSPLNDSEYEFISEGVQGQIIKVIRFTLVDANTNVVNLGFGDVDSATGFVNDRVISGNQDADKILATVAQAILLFTQKNPDSLIYAKGSTATRTRLYQMSLNRHWQNISIYFRVWGLKNENWQDFEPTINYEAFLVQRI